MVKQIFHLLTRSNEHCHMDFVLAGANMFTMSLQWILVCQSGAFWNDGSHLCLFVSCFALLPFQSVVWIFCLAFPYTSLIVNLFVDKWIEVDPCSTQSEYFSILSIIFVANTTACVVVCTFLQHDVMCLTVYLN